MKTIIIEDTESHLVALKSMLSDMEESYNIIGTADKIGPAAELLQAHPDSLVFMDVELLDGTAFDVLEKVQEVDNPIIFTTANEEYAVEAFRWAAMDYLLKPVQKERLREALDRINEKTKQKSRDQIELLQNILQQQKKERIAIHTQEAVYIVNISAISRIEASNNYSIVYRSDGKKIVVTKTLKEYDKMLTGHGFVRVHQSHLVHLDHVTSFIKVDGGYLLMKDGSKVPVASRRKALVLKELSAV